MILRAAPRIELRMATALAERGRRNGVRIKGRVC